MKEQHIQIGSYEVFCKWLDVNNVIKNSAPKNSQYFGLNVIENKYIPKDRALMVDADGKVVQIFNLKTWLTKREHNKR